MFQKPVGKGRTKTHLNMAFIAKVTASAINIFWNKLRFPNMLINIYINKIVAKLKPTAIQTVVNPTGTESGDFS